MRVPRPVVLIVAILVAITLPVAAGRDDETARLNKWLDAAYDEELRFSPMTLTQLGRKELYDQINDYSEAAPDDKFRWRERSVTELKQKFAYQQLYRLDRARAWLKYRLSLIPECTPKVGANSRQWTSL